jgi:hypothetical protein
MGAFALAFNYDGSFNTAIGDSAMFNNISGNENTAIGYGAYAAGRSQLNTAIGYAALSHSSSDVAYANTAIGSSALLNNQTGAYNVAVGASALEDATGTGNIAIGVQALQHVTSGNNNIGIGSNGGACDGFGSISNSIIIGNGFTLCTQNSNYALFGTTSTVWNGGNVPWSTYSDARIKTNVKEDVVGLPFILKLRPVTYNKSVKAFYEATATMDKTKDYPEKYDIEKIRMTGFLAQEVEQAANEVNYNFDGIVKPKSGNDLYSLSYSSFVVPLVKAVQEQQAFIEAQQKKIDELQKKNDVQQKKNDELEKRIAALENLLNK